jgi:TolB-like protein
VVGVPPFAVSGADERTGALAWAVADLVATDLARIRALRVVERTRLEAVLRELSLAEGGRVDPATAPRVGRLVKADRLVLGDVTVRPDGRTLRLGVRVGRVADGSIVSAVDAAAPLADLLAAEQELALRTAAALGVTVSPKERAAIAARPTISLDALLAYGAGLREEAAGRPDAAARAFRRALALDGAFTLARRRLLEARQLQATGTVDPIAIPGLAPLGRATTTTLDRLNRPLDLSGGLPRTGSAGDASFPGTLATIVIVIERP